MAHERLWVALLYHRGMQVLYRTGLSIYLTHPTLWKE